MTEPVLGIAHSKISGPMPAGACDCHVHVFGPPGRYAFAENRTFMPSPVTVDDLVQFQKILGIDRSVVVQASPQGTDNTCLLDTLQALRDQGKESRGVAVVDPSITDKELEHLHAAGVRGLRVNLQSYGISSPDIAASRLQATTRIAASMGWHVQIYTHLGVLDALSDTLSNLPVPLVIDHFGLAHASAGTRQPGFSTLLDLVKDGLAYVKLSAPYRIIEHPLGADGEPIARALIEANPDQMLWGTDWPHTSPPPGMLRKRDTPEPLLPVDDGQQFNIFAQWTTVAERHRILVDNPARLYAFT